MYKYSMTQWIAGNEPVEDSFKRLAGCGYDGIEMSADVPSVDVEEVLALMKLYDLECTSLCGIFPGERNLSDGDPVIAQAVVDYIKANVDYAAAIGARHIIVVPSAVGMTAVPAGQTYEESWQYAVHNIRTAADYAKANGIGLVIEGINRYETFLVNTLEQVMKLVEEIDHPSVGIMADLFHMSIEERDINASIRMVSPYLKHVHIADNTREAAGLGSTDFKRVLITLQEIAYQGVLTMEFLPRLSNPYEASGMETRAALMDAYAKQSIDYMRQLEHSVYFKFEQ